MAGSCTNGCAYDDASAQPYRREALSAVRETAQSSPPRAFSQSTCSAMRKIVASEGVL